MTQLHSCFTLRNQHAFHRILDSGSSGRGQPASLTRPSPLAVDVNARDALGRTVLHLACTTPEPWALEFVRILLAQPTINVNVADMESHWTPLHRALYHGNIAAARLLLQRADTDTSLKDLEGYGPFDVYNATLRTTKPSAEGDMELFTWGANRNATLAHADSDDRAHPEHVALPPKDGIPIHVRQVQMSRLHTAVVTSEPHGNLRMCGFGSGGRLGPGRHTQYTPAPLQPLSHTIVAVALGQDHTLALTSAGEVLSWGLNRFAQLGYVVEGLGRLDEPIQAAPRKVHGALKKEYVRGVAACKTASACWTDRDVFTWGTNSGQLGHEQPVQVAPRKVTKVAQAVLAIALTDSAMVCLLDTHDVLCIWNDRHFKVNFPDHAFPAEMQVYRPPQAVRDANIAKVTSCDDTFAALSANGELFVFAVPKPAEADKERGAVVKPQRVWALRKQFSAVRDVALGQDGSIIICTDSGHVFVRSRSSTKSGGAKAFKFQRVPGIQRVVQVCANNTGAFGALRRDYRPAPIELTGRTLAEDLAGVQPYLVGVPLPEAAIVASPVLDADDDEDDVPIQRDVAVLLRLLALLGREHTGAAEFGIAVAHGADIGVHVSSGLVFPAHRVVLAARCFMLNEVLSTGQVLRDERAKISIVSADMFSRSSRMPSASKPHLSITGCSPISVAILLGYLYSDELLAIWDRRISTAAHVQLHEQHVNPAAVKTELQALARILDLPLLTTAMESPAKRAPAASLAADLTHLFNDAQGMRRADPLAANVVLRLSDRDVMCHSTILRARSPFFAAFFDDNDWTVRRWDGDGTLSVDMRHLSWCVMEFVLRYMCCGVETGLFETLDFVESLDNALEFVFEVMSAANELLLDRLVLLCSACILEHLNANNACFILADATHFHATALVDAVQSYIAANMELFLESHMLDDLSPNLVKQLATFVRCAQTDKSPITRSGRQAQQAMEKHRAWLEQQDFAQPIIRSKGSLRESPKLSPASLKNSRRPSVTSLSLGSPSMRSLPVNRPPPSNDEEDLFEMDGAEPLPALNMEKGPVLASLPDVGEPSEPWKGKSALPKADMKAIMAEAERSNRGPTPAYRGPGSFDASSSKLSAAERTPQKNRRKLQWSSSSENLDRAGSSSRSPWRIPAGKPMPAPISLSEVGPSSVERGAAIPGTPPSLGRSAVSGSPSQPTRPGLGPVFFPSKQTLPKAGSSAPRRVSGKVDGAAWTLPPVQPVVEPSSLEASLSFVAIQQLQLDQGAAPTRDKRSLREIQEEEQARQAEADFLKWWAAEEERLRLEAAEQEPPRSAKPRKAPRKQKGPKEQKSASTMPVPVSQAARKPRRSRANKQASDVADS